MIDALENKVSELIAENDTLKLSNIKLSKKNQEYEADIAELKLKVDRQSKMLEESGKENHHLQQLLTENNKSMISFYQYEAVKLELENSKS